MFNQHIFRIACVCVHSGALAPLNLKPPLEMTVQESLYVPSA